MHKRLFLTTLAAGLLSATALPGALAQDGFPSRNVRWIVPYAAGGGSDFLARTIGMQLSTQTGQTVTVDNKPGANTAIAAADVARSAADGHTLLFTPNTMVISPHVLAPGAGGGVDVHKDLVPVISPATTPMVLVANPQLGATTLKGALDLARKSPGVPYGSPGNGSPMHFAGEMLKRSAGVDLMHVPYRGVGPSITAALSGEVKLLFTGLGGAVPHIKAGKLIPLALTEKARSPLLPDVPTATEQGVAGVEVNAWYGVLAPTGTPAPVIARLNKEFNDALNLPDVRERLAGAGLDVLGGTPQVLADFMKADNERYGKLAKELNIKAD